LTLSLVLHGLFALGLALVPSGEARRAGAPLPVGLLVLDDAPAVLSGSGRNESSPSSGGAAEPEEILPSTVVETPPVPAAGVEPGVGPIIVRAEPGGRSTGPATHGAGQGTGRSGTLFAGARQARRVVYVIDRSLSMGPSGALDLAREELLASLDALPAGVLFQVLLYNRRVELPGSADRPGLVPATAQSRNEVAALLGRIRAEGATDHVQALREALLLRPEVLFLVTDAADLTSEQVRSVTQLNHRRAVIHTIELRDGPADDGDTPLSLLARLNRGTHRVVPVPR
jgi:hypothetical protein